MTRSSRQAAFTLLEVVVAIAITGIVALMAHSLTIAARVAEHGMRTAASEESAAIVAGALTRDVAAHATTLAASIGRADDRIVFTGDQYGTSFTSLCLSARGTRERCRVDLRSNAPGNGVTVQTASAQWTLRTIAGVHFQYLSSVDGQSEWIAAWKEARKLPAGIALVGASDTIVLRLGAPQ